MNFVATNEMVCVGQQRSLCSNGNIRRYNLLRNDHHESSSRTRRISAAFAHFFRQDRFYSSRSLLRQAFSRSSTTSLAGSSAVDILNNKNRGSRTSTAQRGNKTTQFLTISRVIIPSILAGVLAYRLFPYLSVSLVNVCTKSTVFPALSSDAITFVQNFLTVAGLLFSILGGQTYSFLYDQQQAIYYALFDEVTEAKSLLEQVALVCQGRSMYNRCLESISRYVDQDLKQLSKDPAVLLSARPVDDPLEAIMYMTSVGVPSSVYETVRSLRQARARRLGALQRKMPLIHMLLLWALAGVNLLGFPLLGVGIKQTLAKTGHKFWTVEGCLFGVMTASIVLTLCVVRELWRPAGSAYNVDAVLSVMVSGLESELQARMDGAVLKKSSSTYAPSPARIE